MGEALRYVTTGLTIIGVASAFAYCEFKSEEARSMRDKAHADIQIACIKAGGEWVFDWTTPAHCKLPVAEKTGGQNG